MIALRTNEAGVGVNVIDQPLLVAAHFEEIVGFLDNLGFGLMVRAFTVNQLAFGVKTFATETVLSLILAEIDISLVVDFLQDYFDDLYMLRIGGPDEMIVGDV